MQGHVPSFSIPVYYASFLALHGMAMAQLARLRSVAAVVPGQLVHLVWFFKHMIILWARVRFWQQGGKADERRGS